MINKIENGCIQYNVEYKVEQGTITYNGITYNAGDYFIGLSDYQYFDESIITDLIPDMTSNTSPSGECIGDGVYRDSSNYQYWKAFNKSLYDNNDNWISKETVDKPFPHWIGYKFENPVICNKFIVQVSRYRYYTGPKKIKIESSNNGINWVELYKYEEQYFPNSKFKKCYKFDNEIPYLYYRLFIEEGFSTIYVEVGELIMLYEQLTSVIITTTSKIKSVSAEYKLNETPTKHNNKFNNLAIEHENSTYSGNFSDKTQFKELGIEIPVQKEYGEIMKTTNIKMFSKPLNGHQRRIENNI